LTYLSTAGAHIDEKSQSVATAGSASGATSVSSANAAWVAWQIEIMEVQPTAGLQVSKAEAGPWFSPPSGLAASKLEAGPWFSLPNGLSVSKFEIALWLTHTGVMLLPLVYPMLSGVDVKVTHRQLWQNIATQKAASGAEIDLANASTPLHEWDLTYNFLRDGVAWPKGSTEWRMLEGFFGAIAGNLGRFLFKWKYDYQIFNQSIATGDGTTRLFTLQRTFGVGEYSYTEPIGWLDASDSDFFKVYLNGVVQDPSTYSLQTSVGAAQQILLTNAPGNGVAITADMQFFYYCKLADPSLDFERVLDRLWSVKKITIRSCRPNA
jgi:uncharacterized protein (TIGR02217 family)